MAGKTKKIDREFMITDSSVNCYGFRLLTSGYLIDEFKKNPIGYNNHRSYEGVVVRWEDLRIDGDKVYGKPVVNLSNPKGQQIVDEIENGFLNGASVGQIVALKWSEDPEDMLPGQTGVTVTEWFNREASPCDIPGNYNALALSDVGIYDGKGNPLNLSDLSVKNKSMKQIILTAAQLAKLNLNDASTPADVETTINNLAAEAAKVTGLQTELAAEKLKVSQKETEITNLMRSNDAAEIERELSAALAANKMTKEQSDLLRTQYAGKSIELKALVATMKPYQSVTKNLNEDSKDELDQLRKLSGDELFRSGKLDRVKELSAEVYKIKYKEAFNAEPPAEDK